MRAFALLAAAALTAHAQPGFFRDPGDRELERNVLKANSVCTVQVSYNVTHETWVELDGLTVGCYPTTHTALSAAAVNTKLFVLGEPAKNPNYECVVSVGWDPANPQAPSIALNGDPACSDALRAALTAAATLSQQ